MTGVVKLERLLSIASAACAKVESDLVVLSDRNTELRGRIATLRDQLDKARALPADPAEGNRRSHYEAWAWSELQRLNSELIGIQPDFLACREACKVAIAKREVLSQLVLQARQDRRKVLQKREETEVLQLASCLTKSMIRTS